MERATPYSLLARDYDRELGAIFEAFQRPVFEQLLAEQALEGRCALDLACGTGRVAVLLAERGVRVTALDRSRAMLAIARRRAGAERVDWLAASVTELPLAHRFDLITCNFDGINHLLRVAEVRRCFAEAAARLTIGGRFVFDVNTPLALERAWGDLSRVVEQAGHVAIWRARSYPARRRAVLTADYLLRQPDGSVRVVREVHRQRAYGYPALRRWVAGAGLRVRAVRADERWAEPDDQTLRIALVCERAAPRHVSTSSARRGVTEPQP
jgi:SAM-dependent methyltransferase